MQGLRDLSKIGVLLIGVSLLVIAAVVVHSYVNYIIPQMQRSTTPTPFHAYCSHKTVIIHADSEISGVRVLDNRSNQVCFFERIPAGSDELCQLDDYGIYVIQAGEHKRVVRCLEIRIVSLD